MEIFRVAVGQPRAFLLGVGTTVTLIAVGFLLATLVGNGEPAQAQVGGNITACVSLYTGQARFMYPGQAANCSQGEFPLELGTGAGVAGVEARLSALEAQVPACLSDDNGTALFTGCNVQIVSGAGSTNATPNGTGNLIVGYNENGQSFDRSGSHNIVVGADHGYSGYGGLVAGFRNIIAGEYASVTGGNVNVASGAVSSVSGGNSNEASGVSSSVSGGRFNTASGYGSSVNGGNLNEASATNSSVSGGFTRSATGPDDWVAGTLFEDN